MSSHSDPIYLGLFSQLNEILELLGHNTKQSRYNWFKLQLGRSFNLLDEVTIEELMNLYDVACNFLSNRESCMWGKFSLKRVKNDKSKTQFR